MEDEKKELVNEIEALKARVFNLTLYLKDIFNNPDLEPVKEYLEEKYDGLPGYNTNILRGE